MSDGEIVLMLLFWPALFISHIMSYTTANNLLKNGSFGFDERDFSQERDFTQN